MENLMDFYLIFTILGSIDCGSAKIRIENFFKKYFDYPQMNPK